MQLKTTSTPSGPQQAPQPTTCPLLLVVLLLLLEGAQRLHLRQYHGLVGQHWLHANHPNSSKSLLLGCHSCLLLLLLQKLLLLHELPCNGSRVDPWDTGLPPLPLAAGAAELTD